jgi:eukaryotic-like serine/threonine-protein kinase
LASLEETTIVAADTARPTTQPERHQSAGPARGSLIGRYVVLDEIGAGAMGRVFAAYDPRLDRRIALKLLRLDGADPELHRRNRDRLLREAQTLAKLAHPNVVGVHDVELVDEGVAVAMDFIDRASLRDWMRAHPRTWREVLRIFVAAGRGLAAAHRAGVVHRDFKPDNVMVEGAVDHELPAGGDPRVFVVDFGIARVLEPTSDADGWPNDIESDAKPLDVGTRTRGFAGTPAYMAPEQLEHHTADARSDQFAFCISLWEGLYGMRPFVADTLPQLVDRVLHGKVADPPREAAVPGWVRELVRRGLSVDPDRRWSDMEALLSVLQHDPWVTRRRWLVASGVIASVGAGAWGVLAHADPPPCRGAAEALAGVWDEAVAQQIAEAFARVGSSYASGSHATVERKLERYAAEWIAMHADNCEATRIRGEQSEHLMDLRTSCLRQRRDHLRAATELLREADDEIVRNAVQLVGSLPLLDACADVDLLTAPITPPADPEVRRAVDDLRARLAAVDAHIAAGKYDGAWMLATSIDAQAQGLGYAPLRAEALLRLGYLQDKRGDATAAEQTLQEVVWLAQRHRHDGVVARAMNELVYMVGNQLRRADDGLMWARHADAMVGRVADRVELGRLLHNRGLLQLTAGDSKLAEQDLRAAFELREAVLGADHPDTINSLANLATALAELGEQEAAVQSYERGIDEASRTLGADHPRVAGYETNLAELLGRMGEPERALVHAQRAVETYRRTLPPDHPWIISALMNLSTVHSARADWDAAESVLRDALEIASARGDEGARQRAEVLHNLGFIAMQQDDYAAALERLEAAAYLLEGAVGEGHPEHVEALLVLALISFDAEQLERAQTLCTRALEIQRAADRDETQLTAQLLVWLAQIELELDRPEAALAPASEAITLFERLDPYGRHLAQARLALARASWIDSAARPRALELARAALEHAPEDADIREDARQWLAEHDPSGP